MQQTDVNNYDIRDSITNNRIYPTEKFSKDVKRSVYLAIRDNASGGPCQDIYKLVYAFNSIITDINNENAVADRLSVSVTPHPLLDVSILKIDAKGNDASLNIDIYNLDGHKIKSYSGTSTALELKKSDFPTGLYLIKIVTSNGQEINRKLIVH